MVNALRRTEQSTLKRIPHKERATNFNSFVKLFDLREIPGKIRYLIIKNLFLQAEKVQYINYIKEIPSPEGRNAAIALFCGQMQDAESILLQSGLIYRAVQMHIDQFNWDRLVKNALIIPFRIKYVLFATVSKIFGLSQLVKCIFYS